ELARTLIAGCRYDQTAMLQGGLSYVLVEIVRLFADLHRSSQRHRNDFAALLNGPFHSGKYPVLLPRAGIIEHLSDMDVCLTGDAVAWGIGLRGGTTRRCNAMR